MPVVYVSWAQPENQLSRLFQCQSRSKALVLEEGERLYLGIAANVPRLGERAVRTIQHWPSSIRPPGKDGWLYFCVWLPLWSQRCSQHLSWFVTYFWLEGRVCCMHSYRIFLKNFLLMFRELFCCSGLYTVGDEAEGYIVAKFVSPFDSHPFLWIALLAAVPIISFIVLRLLSVAQHKKGMSLYYWDCHAGD